MNCIFLVCFALALNVTMGPLKTDVLFFSPVVCCCFSTKNQSFLPFLSGEIIGFYCNSQLNATLFGWVMLKELPSSFYFFFSLQHLLSINLKQNEAQSARAGSACKGVN